MPRACTICTSPQRAEIEGGLVAGETARSIAAKYRVSHDAVSRHKAAHLGETLLRAAQTVASVQTQQSEDAIDVMAELRRCFTRLNLLFDACDAWLRDPSDPTRYTLEPRDTEVNVIYTEAGDDGKPVRKKTQLAVLLAQLEGKSIIRWEVRHDDPRSLVLKTAGQLGSHLELVANLMDRQTLLARIEALEAQTKAKGR